MPLRIELENLWRRLANRFKARTRGEEDEGYPVLLETLQPITDFDVLAQDVKIEHHTIAVAATGYLSLFTCPAGKRYQIHSYRVYDDGNDTFDTMRVLDRSEAYRTLQVENFTATGDHIGKEGIDFAEKALFFEEGDGVAVNVATHGTGTEVYFQFKATVEDAY